MDQNYQCSFILFNVDHYSYPSVGDAGEVHCHHQGFKHMYFVLMGANGP